MIIKARYVVPVEGDVIESGAVAIEKDRIVAVGPTADLDVPGATDYGHAVICPGLVNAHTHLELGYLAGRVPPGADFADWLRRLVGTMAAEPQSCNQVRDSMGAGIAQSIRSGVTMVGDITRAPAWSREALASSAIRGVSFGEVIAIGSRRHLLSERLRAATDRTFETTAMRIGLSPHSPYTVEPEAMRACAEEAGSGELPVCVHLAETREESAFTQSASGPLAEHLRELGVWDSRIPESGCGPVELVARSGLLSPRTVVAHANYVTDADLVLIHKSGAHVAYCPRTHHAFHHAAHRFGEMMAAGINVCIGTDSLASNPSLSVLDELRFLRRRYRDISGEDLLAMGTMRGARALGYGSEAGSLVAGKFADLVVIPLEGYGPGVEWSSMFDSSCEPVAVYVSGRLVFGSSDGD